MNVSESRASFLAMRPHLIAAGVRWEHGTEPYGFSAHPTRKGDLLDAQMAMDALPTLSTDPNAGIPSWFTTWVDPNVYQILFSPLRAVEIAGSEIQAGDWTDQTAMFPVVEVVGETTAYGDYATSGENSANANFPQRQSFLFQSIIEYGDLEVARYARAKINWITEKQRARMRQLNTFMNFAYFYGVAGLANYGLLNDPNLPASISPAPKAYGGTTWLSGSQVKATANEIYNDIQATVINLINTNAGLVNRESELVLALDPAHEAALTATNSFNVNVSDLLKKNFPKMKVVSAVQYGSVSATQPQGQASGLSLMQIICPEIEGQRTALMAFNAKLVAQRVVFNLSSAAQKMLSGTYGCVLRYPAGIASMVGI
jgi:hypothetical protein